MQIIHTCQLRCLLALALLLVGFMPVAKAQSWAPQGAQWHYTKYEAPAAGYIQVQAAGDTLLGGASWRILVRTKVLHDYDYDTTYTFSMPALYTRYAGDTVYMWHNNAAWLLYDFGAQPGDVWTVPGMEQGCDSAGYILVDSIGSLVLGSDTLRALWVSAYDTSHYSYGNRIIERIGSEGYLLPEPNINCGIADIGEGGPLRCYTDQVTFYETMIAQACDFVPTVAEQGANALQLRAFPTPCSSAFTIQWNNGTNAPAQLCMYSIDGSLQHTQTVKGGKATVSAALAPGMYFLTLVAGTFAQTIAISRL